MNAMASAKRYWREQSGSTAVEFAIIGLFVIVLCVGTVEFGRALHLANELAYAADRGARLVLLDPQVTDSELEAEVRAHLRLADTEGLVITASQDGVASQITRGLTVSLPLTLFIPAFRVQGFRVSVERLVPPQ